MIGEYKFNISVNCVVCKLGLITDFTKETTNFKNNRGRKICPISFKELRTDNTIQIKNTLYSTNGLLNLFLSKKCLYNVMDEKYYVNASFILKLRDPITNINFTEEDACIICSLLFKKIPYFDDFENENDKEYTESEEEDEDEEDEQFLF
jgi:hypothetical protein